MADWIMVVLTGVYVAATFLICFFNYKPAAAVREQVDEMKRQYDEENRPYITTELILVRRAFYGLRFTNHGRQIANHVIIHLDQKFIDSITASNFHSMLEEQQEKERIIGIRRSYDLYFSTTNLLEDPNQVPLRGQLKYSGRTGEVYTDEFSIDIGNYATIFSVNSDADDFKNAIKAQTNELQQIKKALSEIAKKIH